MGVVLPPRLAELPISSIRNCAKGRLSSSIRKPDFRSSNGRCLNRATTFWRQNNHTSPLFGPPLLSAAQTEKFLTKRRWPIFREIPLAATVDGGIGSGLLPDESTIHITNDVGTKKRHSFPRLTSQRKGKTYHPFIDEPDEKELVMYRCLALSKPFTTAKGKGVTEAWTAAVQEINKQKNLGTGKAVFDPPIPAKTVRERFEAAMKIVKDLQAEVPFRSGEDDEDEPNEMVTILEDLYELKTSFESGQSEQKGRQKEKGPGGSKGQSTSGDWRVVRT